MALLASAAVVIVMRRAVMSPARAWRVRLVERARFRSTANAWSMVMFKEWESRPDDIKKLTESGIVPLAKDMDDGKDVDIPFLMGQVAGSALLQQRDRGDVGEGLCEGDVTFVQGPVLGVEEVHRADDLSAQPHRGGVH